MRRFLALAVLIAGCTTAGEAATPSTAGIPSTTTAPTTTAAPTTSTESTTTSRGPDATAIDPALLYDHYVGTEEYRPGLEVEIHAPDERGPWPVVVTIHGGGWYGGTLESMGLLADGLAARNMVVFNVTYRRASQGGIFPGPVDDVACAVSYAADRAADYTTDSGPLVVVGHSAGAHLGALVTMAPGEFGADCPFGQASIEGFVGMAGPYNVNLLGFLLEPWFDATQQEDPDRWARGNPLTHLDTAPEIPYLLVHGEVDQLVPAAFTEELRDALIEAGRSVEYELIPNAGHGEVNDPRVVGDLIEDFVAALQ